MDFGDAQALLKSPRECVASLAVPGNDIEAGTRALRLPSLARWRIPALAVGILLLMPCLWHVHVLRQLQGSQAIQASEASDTGADCVFDVGLATTSLAHAVTTIRKATQDCPKDPYDEGKCPIDISEVFVLFAHTASYFASGVSECPSTEARNMKCESQTAKLLASFGQIATSSLRLHEDCVRVHHKMDPKRRLQEIAGAGNPTAAAGLTGNPADAAALQKIFTDPFSEMPANTSFIAHCSIKASSAVILFGKAMVDLSKAVRYCPKRNNFEAYRERMECSVALQNAIGALGTVASTLASVALECAESVNVQQKCALDISKLVMSLVEVGASASGVQLHCVWQSHGNKTAQK
mmetsp:Transcript_21208/g.41473  ORF Transcript_21208/g.41473 Transcript_21208/m.41473 type:complete len:352 (+) Transcript_21208:105-1160(+)|eukprot:CAMPEP_0172723170 /NCGR_PEP_ID=MMETSP1074-20121228/83140_1 /TAXON_ID=2916 /ORGANISM="Ceratium fusus, Strain PA161109" /LENGTH=351 /DNA_ID=CAMNT_0013549367 /DNA_START=105 /DNA_END=1160 /DNA_ORIENTATION=-